MSAWQKYKFGEVAEFCYGTMPDRKRVRTEGPYPVFSGYQITGYYDEFNSNEDLIIVARGVGGTGEVKISPPKSYVTNLSIIANLNSELVEKRYLYYKFYIDNLRYLDSGSAQSQVTIGDLKKVDILLPPLPEQHAVDRVLSSLDNKIELLNRQNKTLEGLAAAIWRKMFVEDADPNWKKGKLVDEMNITMGQSPPGNTYNEENIGTLFFQGRAEFGFRFPDARLYCTEPKRFAKRFDTLVSVRAPVGDINVAFEDCCIGRGLAAIRHKNGFVSYTFYKTKSLKDDFDCFEQQGTVFGSIGKGDFNGIETYIPDERAVNQFEILSKPLDDKIFTNDIQIRTITKLRDNLLPKLMSGDVRVKA